MRNRVAFDISRIAGMAYTPYCRFVDVVYNGEYEGCYQLCDQVEVNPGRVEITEMETTDNEGDALSGGYFIEIDAYASLEKSWFNAHHDIPVTIKSPDEDEITPAQRAYIEDYFNRLTDAVFGADFADEEKGYRQYLDLDSFLRYFIICELTGNTDTFWSTYMYKERGEQRFVTGPVWDQDLAFNNDNRTYDVNSKADFLYNYGSSAGDMKTFVKRIVKYDVAARNRLSELWSMLRKLPEFNAEHLNALVDSYAEELSASQKLNFTRWPILDQYIHQNPVLYYTYQAEVDAVKNYITRRFDRLDTMIRIVDVPDSAIDIPQEDASEGEAGVRYYNLQGQPVSNPADGLFIRVAGSRATKVRI